MYIYLIGLTILEIIEIVIHILNVSNDEEKLIILK